jgi:hypothetical protein
MYIFVFNYTDGKVYKSELPPEHEAEPENYLIEKNFNLDNIYFLTTTTSKIQNF